MQKNQVVNPIGYFVRLPSQVRWLAVGTGVNNLGNLIGPFLTVILVSKFGISATSAGMIVSAFGLGTVLSILVGGVLTDRFGRKATLLLSLFGGGALATIMGTLSSTPAFLAAVIGFGFITELFRPASMALFADLVASQDRVTTMAVIRVAANLGMTVAMVLGGVFLGINWRYLFWFDGITTLLYGFIVLVFIQEPARHVPHRGGAATGGKPVSPWRDPVFAMLLAGCVIFGAVFMCHVSVLPLIVTKAAGLAESRIGILLGISGFITVAFEISLNHFLARFRALSVVIVGVIVTAAGLAASGLVLNWYWFLLMMLAWTVGEMMTISRLMVFATEYAPAARRGAYLGSWQATWRVANILSPLVFLPLYDRVSLGGLSAVIFATAVPAVLIFFYLNLRTDRMPQGVVVK